MSALDPLRFSPWTSSPGLYSIHNVDTHKVLDQGNSEGDEHQITCCDGEPSLNITNPNQLWLLVIASDEKWLLINKRSGAYLAATDPNHAVVAQVGHPDWSSALWKVLPAECGGLWAIVFLSVRNPGSCLELEEGATGSGGLVKISTRTKGTPGQIWYVKKQS